MKGRFVKREEDVLLRGSGGGAEGEAEAMVLDAAAIEAEAEANNYENASENENDVGEEDMEEVYDDGDGAGREGSRVRGTMPTSHSPTPARMRRHSIAY